MLSNETDRADLSSRRDIEKTYEAEIMSPDAKHHPGSNNQSAAKPLEATRATPLRTASSAESFPDKQSNEDSVENLANQDLLVSAAFARIVSILMRDANYKNHSLADLEWLMVPPLLLGQFAMVDEQRPGMPLPVPTAVALWASVSDEVERRLFESTNRACHLSPAEWDSGPHLWVVELAGDKKAFPQLLVMLRDGPLEGREPKVRNAAVVVPPVS